MALKLEPADIDAEYSFLSDSSGGSSRGLPAHTDTATSMMTSSHPINFLGDQVTSEVILDPMQEDVVFLPHRAPSGRVRRHRVQGVTEYANYTISHLEAEVNSKHLPKKYRCRFCIYKTSYKSDLNRHLRKHGVALQHCPLCNMPFKTAGNLENHIGQVHMDVAENMGILPSALSTMCLKGTFASPVGIGASPDMVTGSHDLQASASDPGHDQPSLQLHKDLTLMSQALRSPPQLHCHMCSFESNDAQLLARHILTHPSEEEVSRISQSSQNSVAVTELSCNGCGVTLSSVGELHDHKWSCASSEDSKQGSKRKAIQSQHREQVDKAKRSSQGDAEAGDKCGLPRQETMNKLRKIITTQNADSDYQTSPSAARQKFSVRKEKRSMILPHIPSDEGDLNKAGHKQQESAPDHPASHASRAETVTGNAEESHVLLPANQQYVSVRNVNNRPSSSNKMVVPGLSANMTHFTAAEQGRVTWSQPPEYLSYKPDDNLHSDRSHERVWNRECVSATLKQMSKSADCHTSNKDHTNEQFKHKTVSVKEEPQSPDASVELEEPEKSFKKDSNICSVAARLDLVTNPASCVRSDRECDLCGQSFRDRTHLIKHVQHAHFLATEPGCPSASIHAERNSSSHHRKSSTQARLSVLSPENNRALPKSQDQSHSSHSMSDDRDTGGQSADRQLYNQRVVPQPPSRGRYALLVSSFDEFASKPYACSLCFFRTAHLSELSVHVHNHLTGGSTRPLPYSACFRPKEPYLAERGTSPWKLDSEAAPNFKSDNVSDCPSSSGDVTGIRASNDQSSTFQHSTAEHSDSRILSSFQEVGDQTHTVDSSILPSVSVSHSVATCNSYQHKHTTGSTSSPLDPREQYHSSETHEVRIAPVVTTAVFNDVDVAIHLDKKDGKHSRSGSTEALMDNRDIVQSDKTRKHPQNQIVGHTQPDLMLMMKPSLVQEGTDHTHDMQKTSASPTLPENTAGSPTPSTFLDNVHRTVGGITSQIMPQSAKKSCNQSCREEHLSSSKRNRQHLARYDNRVRMPKKSGVAKIGVRWNSVNPPSYRCGQCGHRFSVRQLLARHVRNTHSAAEPNTDV